MTGPPPFWPLVALYPKCEVDVRDDAGVKEAPV